MSRPKKDFEYGMSGEVPMCCWTCGYHKELERWDYTNVRKQGVPKTDEGYVCTAFAYEGLVVQMIGNNDDTSYCECWTEATEEEMERKRRNDGERTQNG